MAPESERAMSANDFKDEYDWKEPHDVTYHAPRAAYSHEELIEFAEAYAEYRYWKATEPTLTCSEVVERLVAECIPPPFKPFIHRGQAEKILAEWRERRVQELEEALRELKPHLTGWMREYAERVLESAGVARADQEGREA